MARLTAPIAERKGSEPAVIDEYGETTWAEFDLRVNRVIHGLRSAGVSPGDTVALMCGNRREFFEVTVAAMHSGLVVVPVNWHWVAAELAYVLADSDAAALIVERAAELFDAGQKNGEEANMGKMLASEASWAAAEICVQVHGGFAFAEEFDVERKFRETRLYQVAPISTNLILSYLAEHVLGLPRSF